MTYYAVRMHIPTGKQHVVTLDEERLRVEWYYHKHRFVRDVVDNYMFAGWLCGHWTNDTYSYSLRVEKPNGV